jgi:DNA-binding FadR family transcriptional regulator
MQKRETRTAIDLTADRLRTLVLDAPDGSLIGSEEGLIALLGCSRSTVRQVARLLEREGLLRVRRGINGGYFGSRPDAGTIETTVSSYLETLDFDPRDIAIMASALWIEAVRKAAGAGSAEREDVAGPLQKRIKALKDTATFAEVRDLERHTQDEIFRLGKSNYIKLIFDINSTFSRRKFSTPIHDDDSPMHLRFVQRWRDAKLLEVNAIAIGDQELAALAGVHSRKVWSRRLNMRIFPDDQFPPEV